MGIVLKLDFICFKNAYNDKIIAHIVGILFSLGMEKTKWFYKHVSTIFDIMNHFGERMNRGGNMEYTQEMKNRLKRLEGQVRGVIRMMEEGKDCKEVVTQLSAIRSATDRAIGYVVAKNLETCIRLASEEGKNTEEAIEEAVNLIVKSR